MSNANSNEVGGKMQATAERQELLDALGLVSGVAERKTTLNPVSSVFVEAREEQLSLRATNLSTFVTARIPAEVRRAGQACVSARTFHDVIKSLSATEEDVRLDVPRVETLEIFSGRSRFRLRSLDPDAFPASPHAEPETTVAVSGPLLAMLIRRVYFSVLGDEMKPQMNASLLESEGRILRMVSTDGHRLTKAEVEVEGEGDLPFQEGVLVPRRALGEIRRLVEGREQVQLGLSGAYLYLAGENFELATKLHAEQFPPYRDVIPTDLERKVVVERLALMDAIKRVSLLSAEDTHGVRFQFANGNMEVVANNPDLGEAREELEADYDGADFHVVFNSRYFVEILSEMDSEEVVLHLGEDLDPCLLHGVDDPGYLGVIMPLRF